MVVLVRVMGFHTPAEGGGGDPDGVYVIAAVVTPMVAHRGSAGEFGKGPIGCKTLGNSHSPKGHRSGGFHDGVCFETSASERVATVRK